MYEKNRQLHNQIEELRHQEISRRDQSPSTMRSSSRPEDGARSSVKRRRLAGGNASTPSLNEGAASQIFSSVPKQQNQLPYARHAGSPMPPDNQIGTPLELHNLRGPQLAGSTSTAHRYPLLRQYDTLKARLAIQAASASTYISPQRHNPARRAPTSDINTRSIFKSTHRLPIDNCPPTNHTPAFAFSSNPRQANASSWSQQASEYYSLQSQNHQSSTNIYNETPRHLAQSLMLSRRRTTTSEPSTFPERPHPDVMEGIQGSSHQHNQYLTTPNHPLAPQPFSRSGRRDVPFQWCPPPPPPRFPLRAPQPKAPLYPRHSYPSIPPAARPTLPNRGGAGGAGPGLSNHARSSRSSSSHHFSHFSVT